MDDDGRRDISTTRWRKEVYWIHNMTKTKLVKLHYHRASESEEETGPITSLPHVVLSS
jgi:hypothetical protein